MADAEKPTLRKYLDQRRNALKNERESFIPHYRDLSKYLMPRMGRFLTTEVNKGTKRNEAIINSVGTQALSVATSGLLAGIMSPSRPWFSLGTPDPDLMEFQPVKVWLQQVELILRTILNDSNFYRMAPMLLKELLLFGTGAMAHDNDFDDVARFYTFPAGAYMIDQDDRFKVDTLCREFQMTVGQMVAKFGLDNVNQSVKDCYDKGDYHVWKDVYHIIERNRGVKASSPFSRDMAYRSIYWQPGDSAQENKVLAWEGFRKFAAYCPRWEVTGEDIYGTECPGMRALADVIGLQHEERRKAQAIDLMVRPLLHGPAALKNSPIASLPGGTTLYDATGTGQKLEPIYQIQVNLQEMRLDIDATERRIKEAMHHDLFKAITDMEGIQPRNEFDLVQRNEERLLQLGPMLERVHGELLNPLIDRLFDQAVEADILPPAPRELQNIDLRVTYISTLAMAQRAVATSSIDRLVGFVGGLTKLGFMDAGDKLDADQSIDEYANATGAPARIVVSDDKVAQKRQERAQQMQAQQVAMTAQSAANTAKMASDAKLEDDNLLSRAVDSAAGQRRG